MIWFNFHAAIFSSFHMSTIKSTCYSILKVHTRHNKFHIYFFPHLASILFLANDNSRFMIMITIIGNERWGPQEIQCIVTYDHVSLMYCYHTEDCKTWREKTWIRQRFSGSFWAGRRRKKIECDSMQARFATTVWH